MNKPKLPATQRAQEASWLEHGDNHYARMIEAYALAVRLEAMLRDTMHFLDSVPRNEIKKRIGEMLDGPRQESDAAPQAQTSDLLPCTHCAGTDIRIDEHDEPRSPTGKVFSMCCYDCGATFPNRYVKQLLIDAWNRRAAILDEAKP